MKLLVLSSIFCLVIFGNSNDSNMIYVPGGYCAIESNEHFGDTSIYVNSFYMDKHEVTVLQFSEFVKSTGYKTYAEKNGYSLIYGGDKKQGINWRHDEKGNLRALEDYDEFPVVHLTWDDAVSYAAWAGKRLPTEIEWMHAFREAKNSNSKFSGSNRFNAVAVNSDNAYVKSIGMVESRDPNALGIYDMSGNVSEMCSDRFGGSEPDYIKVAKGGSYLDSKHFMSYSARMRCGPDYTTFFMGFRCVKD